MSDLQEELRAILTAGPQPLMKPGVAVDQAIASLTSLIDREKVKELRWLIENEFHYSPNKGSIDEKLRNRIKTLTPGGSDNDTANPGLRSEQ